MSTRAARPDSTTAVVLSGAAARGAFQAGALAELLPALEADGTSPSILLGTSAGAINAALVGSMAHLPADRTARELAAIWGRMSHANVFRPIVPGSLLTGLQFVKGALLGLGGGTISLLDTDPLRATADDVLDTDRLHANVVENRVAAVGVIATRVPPAASGTVQGTSSGRTIVFLDEHERSGFEGDDDRAQGVARGPIRAEHVIASAAIPVAFPAQRIAHPREAAGWYVDGGVRLNAPLRPAIALGANRLVVISATSTAYGPELAPDSRGGTPDTADAGAQALNAVLGDRLTEDLLALRRMNRMIAQVADPAMPGAPSRLMRRDETAYQTIEFKTISPPSGEMGHVANRIFERKTRGLRAIVENDNWLLGRALRGAGDAAGRRELLSYLLFDEDYFGASIELGRKAARRALAEAWQT